MTAVAVSNPLDSVLLNGVNEAAISANIAKQVRNYPAHLAQLRRFLSEYCSKTSEAKLHGNKKYLNQLQDIADRKTTVVKIYIDDLSEFFESQTAQELDYDHLGAPDKPSSDRTLDFYLPTAVERNATRYIRLLYDAVDYVKERYIRPSPAVENNIVGDIAFQDRISEFERGHGKLDTMTVAKVPIYLRAPYEVRLVPRSSLKSLSVREVRAIHIGSLVRMDGVVTKVSTVKPRLQVAYYKCLDCGADAHQPVEGTNYMPLTHCQSQACSVNQKKGELQMVLPDSKFIRYQEVRVQEPADGVPAGSIPRTQKIIVEGSLTRQMIPGMAVTLSGVLVPVPKTGFQAIHGGLLTDTTFQVEDVIIHKSGYTDHGGSTEDSEFNSEVMKKYENDPELYEKLAASIAPSIHGLTDVKKILLLQLVGGSTEIFPDGMRLRGDIHVLLMGDPGVAKSQLLGQICRIAHRAHYTTGKGSSGVGLTASIVRDGITGDFCLEGGAIVLSDKGICCIDEFDKMDEYDRTAIHEVMEQQTVSISKAGLTTTLNARTSILAAANPQYGRYDIRKSPMQNMNLPAALLSRFDIQYLLLDRADRDADIRLARHVLNVHQKSSNRAGEINDNNREISNQHTDVSDILDAKTIRVLVSRARTFNPKISQSLVKEIVEYYVDLRQRERNEKLRNEFNTYTTPRTLFAVLRISQAIARLRFSELVDRGDFEEALRLVTESKRSVIAQEDLNQRRKQKGDYQNAIMEILKDMDKKYSKRDAWNGWLPFIDVEEMITRNGFNTNQLMKTVEAYLELDVLQWMNDRLTHFGFSQRVSELTF